VLLCVAFVVISAVLCIGCSLFSVAYWTILVLCLMNTPVSLIKSLLFLDLVFFIFMNFVVSVLISISKNPVPLPPPLFT